MPTQRFYNLSEKKRSVIKVAAKHEFSRVLYADASINKIIQEAGISRGSFYTYFEDKEDLLKYLMQDLQDKCKNAIWGALDHAKGDIFIAAEKLVRFMMEYGQEHEDFSFYKNILSDYHLATDTVGYRQKTFLYDSETYRKFVAKCYEKIDREKYRITNAEDLAYLIELMCIVVLKTATMYYMKMASGEEAKNVFDKQMEILKHGICREE